MNNEMKKAYVKKWLDYQVDIFNKATKHMDCVDNISLLSRYTGYVGYAGKKNIYNLGIHISGVDEVARLLDLPVKVVAFADDSYGYEYEHQITYNGVVFYGLYSTSEVK